MNPIYKDEYHIWKEMKQRCYNSNNKSYKNYGERDIEICDRWYYSFENFLEDMGSKPGGKYEYTLERIDNDKNYEPDNCKWATYEEQNQNKRHTLTQGEIDRIRKLYQKGIWYQKELAIYFNTTEKNISTIVTNRTWRNSAKDQANASEL
jgi:hypothetical protein